MYVARRSFVVSLIAIAAAAFLWLAITKAHNEQQNKAVGSKSPDLAEASASRSTTYSELTLAREIDQAIDQSDSAQARWGICVVSLKNGQIIYARNGDKLFTPASNMKIYTTAVALDLLGADYRWRTSVYAEKQPANGVVDGDLVLYGRGAPDLRTTRKGDAPSLDQLADQVYQTGVHRVHGNIVGDESYFRGEFYGVGWQWNDLQWYFGAQPSALTVDENSIELTISPAKKVASNAIVTFDRKTEFLHLINDTKTGELDATISIGIDRGLSDNEVRVWGEFPTGGRPFSAFISVHNPALWTATLFKEALVERGIQVDGEAQSRDARVAETENFEPLKAFEVASIDSEPLAAIVRHTNKESDNLYAELILRTIGKERRSLVSDLDTRRDRARGDDEAGSIVVRWWLKNHGISGNGLALNDGSGLSRLDLVTPEATARLLATVANSAFFTIFHDSLPIAGRDGTLRGRLAAETGRVFAKTGSLTYDHALSGYVVTASGDIFSFSVFCNDATEQTHPVRIIDEIVTLLVNYDDSKPPRSGQK